MKKWATSLDKLSEYMELCDKEKQTLQELNKTIPEIIACTLIPGIITEKKIKQKI